MKPTLSIITITYNAEAFLERTILSLARAIDCCTTAADIEYLIIDGNSKDRTLDIVGQYKNHVTRWISEPDRGLYDAMNKGLAMATGDYVWFLNAGDEVHDVQTLAYLFEAFGNQADVYYGDTLLVENDGREVGLRSQITPHRLPKNLRWQDMALGMKVCHQAFITRRSIAPVYDTNNLSADIDWEIKCLKQSKNTIFLDFVLCRYLLGGLSTQKHRQSLFDRFRVLKHHFGLIPTIFNHFVIIFRAIFHKQ